MPAFDVVTFGETMIRLSPPGCGRLENADSLDMRIGGSESNVACALTRLGRKVAWWSMLVDDGLGRRVAASIRRWGIDTSHAIWTPTGRTALYFIEFGSPPRPHQVHYDRANSAMSQLTPDEVDWSHLDQARHLHVTGITPALSPLCAATVLRGVREAKARGLTVSFDVNFRRKLWSAEAARAAFIDIFPSVDLLFCPAPDAEAVFGLDAPADEVAAVLARKFGIGTVVVTTGVEGAVALQGDALLSVPCVPTVEVDRVGGGDAFDAGVIDGFLDGDLERGLRYGAAMAALKHTIPGDELIATREEIEAVLAGVPTRIQR